MSNKTDTNSEIINNASLTALVKSTLLSHSMLSVQSIKVVIKNGMVCLGGKVVNQAEKDMVTKLVHDVRGIIKVVNNMTID